MTFILAVVLLLPLSTAYTDFVPHMEDVGRRIENNIAETWGYIEVREGAHMFWWLYLSTHEDGYQNRSLITWLQGGPGLSGTALGNFMEIGPRHMDLTPRNATWLQEASILFIDNPVGTGYSYLDNGTEVASGIEAISADMVNFFHVFLQQFPEFKDLPLFLFGQSYGGKYVTHLGYSLEKLKQAGGIDINLRGIGIGNGFVSPTDFALNYGDFLYQTGVIDDRTLDEYRVIMEQYIQLTQEGKWEDAFGKFAADGLGLLFSNAPGLDFYNILQYHSNPGKSKRSAAATLWSQGRPIFSIYDVDMEAFMNGPIRDQLEIITEAGKWGETGGVYDAQIGDFVQDTIFAVDWLLQNSDVQINVYEGQLDLACETSGAVSWVNKLTWSGLQKFRNAERRALVDPITGSTETFVKSHKTLKFYWNLNAGHTVPTDVPYAALRMLRRILNNEDH